MTDGSTLALYTEGVRGRSLGAIATLTHDTSVCATVAPGQYAPAYGVSKGIMEGGKSYPRRFVGHTHGMSTALREAGSDSAPAACGLEMSPLWTTDSS